MKKVPFCPFYRLPCEHGSCAWYSKENGMCAVQVIAQYGGFCCQPHVEYAELLPDDETDMEDRC